MHFIRGKGKNPATHKKAEFYKSYRATVKNPVDLSTYVKVLRDFFSILINKMIVENFEFKVPQGLGRLYIRSKTIRPTVKDGIVLKNNMAVDWNTTKKLWKETYPDLSNEEIMKVPYKKLLYFMNPHSDGKTHQWYWDKVHAKFKNQKYYKINIARGNDKLLSEYSKENKVCYYE